MKDTPREQFRWAAHTGGLAIVKEKDYDSGGSIEALTLYAAWKAMLAEDRPLHPGDLLARYNENGDCVELHIAKYIGFEPAQWFAPTNNTDSPFPSGKASENNVAPQISAP